MDNDFDTTGRPPLTADILHDLGFFGHYLHIHAGGRGGKQFVLTTLRKHEGKMNQRELLDASKISSAALSEVLAKLEAEGLVRRTVCEHDRRKLLIALTDQGRARAEEIWRDKRLFEKNALSCLEDEEQTQLKDMLGRMVAHWKSLEEEEVTA